MKEVLIFKFWNDELENIYVVAHQNNIFFDDVLECLKEHGYNNLRFLRVYSELAFVIDKVYPEAIHFRKVGQFYGH